VQWAQGARYLQSHGHDCDELRLVHHSQPNRFSVFGGKCRPFSACEIGACSNLEEAQQKSIFLKFGLSQSASHICSPFGGSFPSCPRRWLQKSLVDISGNTIMSAGGEDTNIDDDYGIQQKSNDVVVSNDTRQQQSTTSNLCLIFFLATSIV
jgi:hypothetical protein